MAWSFKAWRRRRILRQHAVPELLWQGVVARLSLLRGMTPDELRRLRDLTTLFLHAKQMSGAGGLAVTDGMRVTIAAQACLPILNLDLDYYDGWVEIIVYPDEFVPEYEYTDEDGLVHHVRAPMSGEAWLGGPVILSWHDAGRGHEVDGYNVVIHEFAHKLDMLNGDANGFPPLHAGMSRQAWSAAFGAAYENFCARVDGGEDTAIDPYASETPGEFFAVMSEAFFEMPQVVKREYPEVYAQLGQFYRQDPAARI
jgi:Mlc titration factor MtfA (ptsG expression regulator)